LSRYVVSWFFHSPAEGVWFLYILTNLDFFIFEYFNRLVTYDLQT